MEPVVVASLATGSLAGGIVGLVVAKVIAHNEAKGLLSRERKHRERQISEVRSNLDNDVAYTRSLCMKLQGDIERIRRAESKSDDNRRQEQEKQKPAPSGKKKSAGYKSSRKKQGNQQKKQSSSRSSSQPYSGAVGHSAGGGGGCSSSSPSSGGDGGGSCGV